MNEQPERHWIDNVADLISGRIHNTFGTLHNQVALLGRALLGMENKMTLNEERIENAVASLKTYKDDINSAVQALKDKIANTPAAEDLSQELNDLDAAVGGIHDITTSLATPAPPVVSENHDPAGVADPTIDHGNNPVIPLAGESGPTDAGVPTQVPQPGAPIEDPVATPVADDAQGDAGLPAGEDQSPSDSGTEDASDSGDEDETDPSDADDVDEEDEFELSPAPADEVPAEEALPETQEPELPEPTSDPEFVASDPVTGDPVEGDPAPATAASQDPTGN